MQVGAASDTLASRAGPARPEHLSFYVPRDCVDFDCSLLTWSRLCQSLARTFQNGWRRRLLVNTFREHGWPRCPKIKYATNVRFIVYCGEFLRQSIAHHALRQAAMSKLLVSLEHRVATASSSQKASLQAKLTKARRLNRRLGGWDIFMALLVEEALHTDRGFIETCTRIQATKEVFFPLQLLEGSAFWLLAHLGFPAPLMQRKSEEVMVPTEEGGAFQHAAPRVKQYRCRFCGLLCSRLDAIFQHLRGQHGEGSPIYKAHRRSEWEALCKPDYVYRLRPTGHRALPSPEKPGPEPFAGLALRQPGATAVPLEMLSVHLGVLTKLLRHVHRTDDSTVIPLEPVISIRDWRNLALDFLPARFWRQHRKFSRFATPAAP